MSNGYYYCQECQNTVKFKHDCVMDKSIRIGLDINTRPHTEPYVDRMWQEYYKMKDEQIEHIMQQELTYQRDSLKHYLTLANDGNNCRIFSIDLEEEKKELRRYVEALDLIIDYYTVPKYRKYE